MKIAFFLLDDKKATTISGKMFAEALVKCGYRVEVVQNDERKQEILHEPDCDLIFFQKTLHPSHRYNRIRHLKGKVYMVHIDDDFYKMDDDDHLKTLNLTDLVLVGNRKHAELLKYYISTPIEVITSISDFENYPYTPFECRNNTPLIISWQQNLADEYVDDLLMIAEALIRLFEKYKIKLHLYGWHKGKDNDKPDMRPMAKQELYFAKFFSYKPFKKYLTQVVPRMAQSDISIVPYRDIPDRYGKSGFGLKRMMMLGVPVVSSRFQAAEEVLTDGVNGYLATNLEEWFSKIEDLILRPDLRKQFSTYSRYILETKCSYDQCLNIFINAVHKHINSF